MDVFQSQRPQRRDRLSVASLHSRDPNQSAATRLPQMCGWLVQRLWGCKLNRKKVPRHSFDYPWVIYHFFIQNLRATTKKGYHQKGLWKGYVLEWNIGHFFKVAHFDPISPFVDDVPLDNGALRYLQLPFRALICFSWFFKRYMKREEPGCRR